MGVPRVGRGVSGGYLSLSLASLLLIAMLFVVVGCKKKKEGPNFELEDELARLEAYRKVNYPEAIPVGENAFYSITHRGGGASIGENAWLEVDYSAFDLSGNLQGTSMEKEARKYSRRNQRMHFVPHVLQVNKTMLSTDFYEALRGASVGDTLMLGLPSSSVQKMQIWNTGEYISSVVKVVPIKVIDDTESYEREKIDAYLKDHPELKRYGNIYREVIVEGQGDTIDDSYTLWVQYAGYFLDGMLFDTNVLEEAQRHNYPISNMYPMELKAYGDDRMIDGFSGAFSGLKIGSRVRILIPSDLGYGASGRAGIRPFETLVFEVSVIRGGRL